jgi:carboxyl-terminal processing protease
MSARALLSAMLLALLVPAFALPAASTPAAAREAEARDKADTKVYDEVWRLVERRFFDRNLRGLDWKAVGDRHRGAYAAAKTDAERSAAINAMLGELESSHTRHYTRDETAYYELMDIFSYHLRKDVRRLFSNGPVHYRGIGMFTKEIDGKIFVSAVFPGLPADKAGLRVGDEIVSADGAPFGPVASFRDKLGSVELKVRRIADGPLIDVSVKPVRIEPDEVFEEAVTNSARIIEANGRRIGYVRIWNYAGDNYQSALIEALSEGKLKDADALIWDLRDGWGGAQPRYLDIFNPYGPTLTLTERDGEQHVSGFRWRKPVALLINGGTRSGKEVLSYGFKKNGYGPVIGERTAGALLAGTAFVLSDDSLLILAVNDASVDGDRIEGKGVGPTIPVPFDIRYADGKDPQLDKAVQMLSEGA